MNNVIPASPPAGDHIPGAALLAAILVLLYCLSNSMIQALEMAYGCAADVCHTVTVDSAVYPAAYQAVDANFE